METIDYILLRDMIQELLIARSIKKIDNEILNDMKEHVRELEREFASYTDRVTEIQKYIKDLLSQIEEEKKQLVKKKLIFYYVAAINSDNRFILDILYFFFIVVIGNNHIIFPSSFHV